MVEQCPECGSVIPASPDGVRNALFGIRVERRAWLIAAIGFLTSSLCVWLLSTVRITFGRRGGAGYQNAYDSLASTLTGVLWTVPFLACVYIAWRLRSGVVAARSRRSDCSPTHPDDWCIVAMVAAVLSWVVPGFVVLMIVALLSG